MFNLSERIITVSESAGKLECFTCSKASACEYRKAGATACGELFPIVSERAPELIY